MLERPQPTQEEIDKLRQDLIQIFEEGRIDDQILEIVWNAYTKVFDIRPNPLNMLKGKLRDQYASTSRRLKK